MFLFPARKRIFEILPVDLISILTVAPGANTSLFLGLAKYIESPDVVLKFTVGKNLKTGAANTPAATPVWEKLAASNGLAFRRPFKVVLTFVFSDEPT